MSRLCVIAIALTAVACRDEGLARLEVIRTEVCACDTRTCGRTAMAKVAAVKVEPTRRSQQLARDMVDCLARLPVTDRTAPPAEDAATSR